MLGDPGDAEEAAQDALVRAYRALATYDAARIRELRLRPLADDDRAQPMSDGRGPRRATRGPRPISLDGDGDAVRRTRGARPRRLRPRSPNDTPNAIAGRRACGACRPSYRAAVVLRHVDGLSYPEAAAALGRPEGTVKAQVHRGIALLRTMLEAESPPRARGDDRMTSQLDATDRRGRRPSPISLLPAPPTLRASVLVEVGLADRYGHVDSPLGPLVVAWNGRGVSTVDLAGDDGGVRGAPPGHDRTPGHPGRGLPPRLANAIARRLDGDRRVRIELDLRGHSPFEQDVWRKALEIPRGEVRPYGWIAAEIGRPKAVRAVGTALGHNPVPLIVPCHRVVRTDGSIGQYSLGGPENKRTILAARASIPTRWRMRGRRGERLVGCASTRIVCWPTCRTGRHMLERNRRPFRSLDEAGRCRLPAVQGLPAGRGRRVSRG